MIPDLNSFYRDPDPEPRKVITDWHEDLVVIKVGNCSLGIEANLEVLKVVIDVLEFVSEAQMGGVERDQAVDDLSRVVLSMEGK